MFPSIPIMPIHNPSFSRRAALAVFAVCLPLTAGDIANIRGIPNFHAVNDRVYRGGQPSGEGFRQLAAAGIKTVVDLRDEEGHIKNEKRFVKSLGMRYVSIPMKGMRTPSEKSVSHALKVLHDEHAGPVFIHCKRGADRSGLVLACYRMEHDNWSNREALDEARSYGMSWYQFPLIRYVAAYRPHGDSRGGTDKVSDAVDTLKDLPKRATEIFK